MAAGPDVLTLACFPRSNPVTDPTTSRKRVAFIGLGAMGAPMAARVAAAGYGLAIFDADANRCADIAAEIGCSAAASAAAVADGADLIVTMLPNSSVVSSVLMGPDGVLSRIATGALVIEMSSGEPGRTRELAEAVSSRGAGLIDAPVSGGVARAKTGELAIMVGGSDTDFAAAEPVLRTMGSSLLRTGDVGSAHAMKALNNLVSAGGFLIGIEALLIGARYGLDPAAMVDVLNASTGMNNSTQKKFKQFVLSRRFDAGFGLDLMVKDLGIAMSVAEETGTAAPFAALCRQIWASARAVLGPGQDHTALARFSEMLAGMELSSDADDSPAPDR
jgi:3-hydroxyisobutyrate dehydrogenase